MGTFSLRRARVRARAPMLIVVAVMALAAFFVGQALASGSGVMGGCSPAWLSPGTSCHGTNEHDFSQVQSYDGQDGGIGSCAGVDDTNTGNGTGDLGHYCQGDVSAPSYNYVECTTSCNGYTGWDVEHDHSSTWPSDF